ncbi:MetQ/NlpA family ABC transporter substrate-binding protein [Candidatus Protochlamydia sp. R18]|uniref:MetQ/NlpA family ABC transporter substrate-binding protein n=1 Tax=Candidatus Protochlamydia sp. R18 TaxID=1353977 RepID=UPI0005AB794C|nr:MetQ/NlpA family ABC transporter substrate-binding protein [Candidatus Protochlamydia sp. R18]
MKKYLKKIIGAFYPALLVALVALSSCSRSSKTQLEVAATSVPHAEILEFIKPELKEQGINLSIITVDDYHTPNRALQDREVDANFFQHLPFLEAQIADFGYQLEPLVAVHLEPMGLYSQKLKSLKKMKNGLTLAIPSDPSNQARALAMLQQLGFIRLKKTDAMSSVFDIIYNTYHLKFIEIDSPLLARSLNDVDLAAITTNFALQAGLSPQKDALALEDKNSQFVNVVAVRAGEINRKDLQILKQVLTSEKVKDFIESHYRGAVIPAF